MTRPERAARSDGDGQWRSANGCSACTTAKRKERSRVMRLRALSSLCRWRGTSEPRSRSEGGVDASSANPTLTQKGTIIERRRATPAWSFDPVLPPVLWLSFLVISSQPIVLQPDRVFLPLGILVPLSIVKPKLAHYQYVLHIEQVRPCLCYP